MRFLDSVTTGQPRITSDGYLVADVKAARTGIQLYTGAELGRPDLDIVRVYRPESEVFHKDSLASYAYKPAVNGHPSEPVTADNWKQVATGQLGGDVVRDGDHVRVPLVLMDAQAIADYNNGRRELSMGYACDVEFERGVTDSGEEYDAIQRKIRINHISQEQRGRARTARIGDSWGVAPINDNEPPTGTPPTLKQKGGHMTTKTVVLGDKAVQVLAEDAAEVERFKDAAAKALADTESKHEQALAAKDAELEKLQARLDDAKSKILSDEDIDAKVAARAELIATAKKIAPTAELAGLSDAAIRKAVVTARLGDAAITDKSDAYIDARFDILAEDTAPTDPVRDAIKGGIKSVGDAATQMNDAHQKSVSDLNAWRNAQ
ncbi:MAG: DUF2213 domain-containing protein [Kiritimatiellia bacterium]